MVCSLDISDNREFKGIEEVKLHLKKSVEGIFTIPVQFIWCQLSLTFIVLKFALLNMICHNIFDKNTLLFVNFNTKSIRKLRRTYKTINQ